MIDSRIYTTACGVRQSCYIVKNGDILTGRSRAMRYKITIRTRATFSMQMAVLRCAARSRVSSIARLFRRRVPRPSKLHPRLAEDSSYPGEVAMDSCKFDNVVVRWISSRARCGTRRHWGNSSRRITRVVLATYRRGLFADSSEDKTGFRFLVRVYTRL